MASEIAWRSTSRRNTSFIQRVLSSHLLPPGIAGAFLTLAIRAAMSWWWRRRLGERNWRRKVDFSDVQACILSTEHTAELGRMEKRTLFVKPLKKVFRNEYVLEKLLEAAEHSAESGDPMLMTRLSVEDKWHVLNACVNQVSACFAPYHLFFNEARRVASHYRSAWYCFTVTCHRNTAGGRWFITPFKPVGGRGDVGMLRIRIVIMSEDELRDIAVHEDADSWQPSNGFFNARHESRWGIAVQLAKLFQRQLQQISGSNNGEWGRNLCGTLKRVASVGDPTKASVVKPPPTKSSRSRYQPEDNCILRLHVPVSCREMMKVPIGKGEAAQAAGQWSVSRDREPSPRPMHSPRDNGNHGGQTEPGHWSGAF